MKVAMYYNNNDVRVEEKSVPQLGPDEFLVKVMASGICGTDVLEWYRLKTAPRVLGHEMAGEIVELGSTVKKYKIGDRVFVTHHVPCNTCYYCLNNHHTACETLHRTNYDPGGFAEYIRIPGINVDRGTILIGNMPYDTATFIEPLACIVRAQRMLQMSPGYTMLIIGSGISGLLHLKIAQIYGAGKIIAVDINEYRLNKAKQSGADFVVTARDNLAEYIRSVNNNRLADLVILCTGVISASQQAINCVEPGGTILFFAVPPAGVDVSIPITSLWRQEIKMLTSYGAALSDLNIAYELLNQNKIKVDDMITHRFPLSEIGQGFKLVAQASESVKVIIYPHGNQKNDHRDTEARR